MHPQIVFVSADFFYFFDFFYFSRFFYFFEIFFISADFYFYFFLFFRFFLMIQQKNRNSRSKTLISADFFYKKNLLKFQFFQKITL